MTTTDAQSPRSIVVESVRRAMGLLDLFEPGRPELTLAEFVRRSGYSKSTTYRLLVSLEDAGWLERGQGATFRLTIRPFQIGSILVDSLDLRHEAGPVMTRLAAETGETVFLVVPSGTMAVCLERIDSPQGVRLPELNVGGSQPLHLGAAPRALLAFDEERLLAPLLDSGLTARTDRTLINPETLRDDLAQTRERGYSVSDEDVTSDVAAIGAPVFDARGTVVGALSIGGLRPRLMPVRHEHVTALLDACRRVSHRLGHHDA